MLGLMSALSPEARAEFTSAIAILPASMVPAVAAAIAVVEESGYGLAASSGSEQFTLNDICGKCQFLLLEPCAVSLANLADKA